MLDYAIMYLSDVARTNEGTTQMANKSTNTSKPVASKAKDNRREINGEFLADLSASAYSQGAATRATAELLASGKIDWNNSTQMKELSASFRRGYLASLCARDLAGKIEPDALKSEAFALADKLIATSVASRNAIQTKLYNAAKSAFGHACRLAGMPVKQGSNKGQQRGANANKPATSQASTDKPAPVELEAITIPRVKEFDEVKAFARRVAHMLEVFQARNADAKMEGLRAVFADFKEKIAKASPTPVTEPAKEPSH